MALGLGLGQPLNTSWFQTMAVQYPDTLLRPWASSATTSNSVSSPATSASSLVFTNWWWGVTAPVAPASKAGGTGSSRVKKKEFKRKVIKSEDIFREEMAKLEADLHAAVAERVLLEHKIDEIPLGEPVPLSVQRFIIQRERSAELAQLKERLTSGIPVYVKVRREKAAALKRMQRLLHIAQHQEFVAQEKLRQITEQIDEEAAGHFMRWLMAEWEWE